MSEGVDEKDVLEALRRAREFADEVKKATARMPKMHAERLLRSSTATVTNLAMALEVLRRQRSTDAGQADQV